MPNANGEWTVTEVATHFGVRSKTIYEWIKQERVPSPPQTRRGFRKQYVFTTQWVQQVERIIDRDR